MKKIYSIYNILYLWYRNGKAKPDDAFYRLPLLLWSRAAQTMSQYGSVYLGGITDVEIPALGSFVSRSRVSHSFIQIAGDCGRPMAAVQGTVPDTAPPPAAVPWPPAAFSGAFCGKDGGRGGV